MPAARFLIPVMCLFTACLALSPVNAPGADPRLELTPGDHIISSYGYANESFKFIRQHGGKTFVDAGNSHIENFWETLSEEHRRWQCPTPPVAPHWIARAKEMLAEQTDFVLSPSSYVTNSFLARGFKPEQILKNAIRSR